MITKHRAHAKSGNLRPQSHKNFKKLHASAAAVRFESLERRALLSAVSFSAATTLATGTHPQSVAVGDLNGDGHADLVVANYGSNTVSVILSNGNGTFKPQQTFAVGAGPSSVAIGDFNGDGKADLAVTNFAANTISVLQGNGDGTFLAQRVLPAGTAPDSIAVSDLNHDGNPDLVVANRGSNTLGVLLGNADGTFQSQVTYAVGSQPQFVTTADVNGDGKADLVVANTLSGNVGLLLGNGDGTFETQQIIATVASPTSVSLSDIDGDGNLDLVAVNSAANSITVALGVNDGTFQAPRTFVVGTNPMSVVVADFNGDGNPDVAVANLGSNSAGVLSGNGDGTFAVQQSYAVGNAAIFLATGDFNGDGKPDLVVADSTSASVSVLLNTSVGGAFVSAPTFSSANSTMFTSAAAGTFTIATVNGFPAPRLTEVGVLPPHVRFVNNGDGTATLEGTPLGAGKTYHLTFAAHSAGSPTVLQAFTLIVDHLPAITSANHATFTTGANSTFTVVTTGFPVVAGNALTLTGTLPTGVSFNGNANGTGTLAGSPIAGTGGTYLLTFAAHNAAGTASPQTFLLTVNEPESITSPDSAAFVVGVNHSVTVTTAGFPFARIQALSALPRGLTLTSGANGTATISGTATGAGKVYQVILLATNRVTSARQTLQITVDEAPVLTSAASATFSTTLTGNFLVKATGLPVPAISETGSLPAGINLVDNGNGTASLTGKPTTDGTFTFTLAAANGVGTSGSQIFTLNVDEPVAFANAGTAIFTAGTTSTFHLATSGFPAATLRAVTTLPAGLTFNAGPNGTATITGSPTGTANTFTVSISATNHLTTAVQSLKINVDRIPAITSAASTSFSTAAAGTFAITTSGFPAPTIAETGSLPTGVTFTDNGDGTAALTGRPSAGGIFVLTLTASNPTGVAATQTFTLNVNQALAITSTNSAALTVGTVGTFTVTTTGFPAPTLSETGTLPSGVTVTNVGNGTATLTGTPAGATGGTYVLTLTANNGVGANATQTFTLTIDQAPAVTSLNHATFTTGALGTFAATATGLPGPDVQRPAHCPVALL